VLIAANFWILKPFLTSFVWATIIAVATWPVLLRLQSVLGGKRGITVAIMTLAILTLLIIPVAFAVLTILENTDRVKDFVKSLETHGLPSMPEWVSGIPLAGPKIAEAWSELASAGREGLLTRLAPYAGKIVGWLVDQAGGMGMMLIQFLLTVIITAILFSSGEAAATGLRRFFRRLAGQKGEGAVELAGKAVRAVALGVVVTALVQTTLAGVGLAVAGIPHAGLLTAIVLVFCIAQIGPLLVMAGAVIWLYATGSSVWGTVLLVWSVGVVSIDNILRPVLIKKGADLPLLLIFAGVIGGLVGFGVVGLFIGPAVLAVAYTLVTSWIAEMDKEPDLAGH